MVLFKRLHQNNYSHLSYYFSFLYLAIDVSVLFIQDKQNTSIRNRRLHPGAYF